MAYCTISNYTLLIEDFLTGKMDCKLFETEFINLFKSDQSLMKDQFFEPLNELFIAVDLYEQDPKIRKDLEMTINEQELILKARKCLMELTQSRSSRNRG